MNSIVVDSGLNEYQLEIIYKYCIQKSKEPSKEGDTQIPGTPSYYNDPMMKALQLDLIGLISRCSDKKLYPTYTYWRSYKFGDILHRHTDRPSCEISATLHLAHEGEDWPIFIIDNTEREVNLKTGEMLLYEGCTQPHWRDKYMGGRYAQCFLHYVNAEGPYKEWKFDKHETY